LEFDNVASLIYILAMNTLTPSDMVLLEPTEFAPLNETDLFSYFMADGLSSPPSGTESFESLSPEASSPLLAPESPEKKFPASRIRYWKSKG